MTSVVTALLVSAILVYGGLVGYLLYGMYNPPVCPANQVEGGTAGSSQIKCVHPYFPPDQHLDVYLVTSVSSRRPSLSSVERKATAIYRDVPANEPFTQKVTFAPPKAAWKNSTLHLHVFVMRAGSPLDAQDPAFSQFDLFYMPTHLTRHLHSIYHNKAVLVDYAQGADDANESSNSAPPAADAAADPISHLRRSVSLYYANDENVYDITNLPLRMEFVQYTHYRPLMMVASDTILSRSDWRPLDMSVVPKASTDDSASDPDGSPRGKSEKSREVSFDFIFRPSSIGTFRLMLELQNSFTMMTTFGLSEHDLDPLKEVFFGTELSMLALTYAVSLLHILFSYLAFKNEIGFWRGRSNFAGISTSLVFFNFCSSVIIFLFLLDSDNTSSMIVWMNGISLVIDTWKALKLLGISFAVEGGIPRIKYKEGAQTVEEKKTEQLDMQAMKYLQLGLVPLVIGLAVYSLLYTPHKSWYSWVLTSLSNGVYMFGFVFMTPQLFINYKLKSVAHLPWRPMMYKAFNTFVDDVFSFIVTMPTAHRLACLRDDLVFIIFLYQRWLYPVDMARTNEFGYSYEQPRDEKDAQGVGEGANRVKAEQQHEKKEEEEQGQEGKKER